MDGSLLDPPLKIIQRFEQSYTCTDEEIKHMGTTTPPARKHRSETESEDPHMKKLLGGTATTATGKIQPL